jgi:hypothetical protein
MYRAYRDSNSNVEITELALYLEGLAAGLQVHHPDISGQIGTAAQWLHKLSPYVCGQGMVGCKCGPKCGSDHK